MKRRGAKSKTQRRKKLNIALMIGGALFALLLLFLVMDNFVLYWFILFNNNDTLERRQQGSEWYGEFASGEYNPGGPDGVSSSGGGNYGNTGFVGNFDNMTPEEAAKAVSRNLTEDEKYDFESAMRIFIYIMDRRGFVPNATIGAMSNMMAESGTMGLYAYESHYIKSNPGPDGSINSRYLGNQEWVDWLNGPGREWARDKSSSYKGKAKYSIGLGLIQSTDSWSRSSGEKTLFNATYLLENATEEGMYWQEPGFQIPYYMKKYFASEEPFGRAAWDTIQSPGVDPTTDANVTAYEWATRVYCGVEYPGLVYNEAKNYTSGDYHDQIITHTAGIDAATELYKKYSKVDPWFYSKQVAGSADWRDPFGGPVYDNTTEIGVQIARMAVLLAGTERVAEGQILFDRWGLASTNLQDPRLAYYKEAQTSSVGTTDYYASCDYASTLAVLLAGADTTIPRGNAPTVHTYLENSSKWKKIGTYEDIQPQPGDVMSSEGHVAIYVGTHIAGERWSGTTTKVYQASYGEYFPDMSIGSNRGMTVYRCIQPDWSSTYWDKFMAHIGTKFPELPRTYKKTSFTAPPASMPDTTPNTSTGTELDTTGFVYPLPDNWKRVSSRLGSRNDPVYKGKTENHKGNDIPATDGTPIYSALAGTVGKVTTSDGRGRYVRVDSPDKGYSIIYQHMSANYDFIVKEGDVVTAGQQIGYVGTTGKSTGNHLHFEVCSYPYDWTNGSFYDIEQFYPNLGLTF